MRCPPFVPILVALCLAGVGPIAQEAPNEEVARWIRSLAADDFTLREDATLNLVKAGLPARGALEAALPGLPIEARLRAEAILAEILGPKRSIAFPTEPTRIDFEVDGVPLSEVLARLSDLSGATLRLAGPADGRGRTTPRAERAMSLSFQATPLLAAVDQLATAAGFYVSRDYLSGDFLFSEGRTEEGLVRYAGPFRVALTGAQITRQTRFGGAPSVHASLQIRVDAEPRVDLIGLLHPLEIPPAKDDQGREVVFLGSNAQVPWMMQTDPRRQFHLSATFEPPAADAKKVLGLTLPLRWIVPDELIVVDVPFVGVDRTPEQEGSGHGPLDLRVLAASTAEGQTSITLSFLGVSPEGTMSLQSPPRFEDIQAFDGEGRPMRGVTVQPQADANGRSVRLVRVPGAIAPTTLRLRLLSRWRMERLDVAFDDVPLP